MVEAVKQSRGSLHLIAYVSDELSGDKEVVLEAVKQRGFAFCYASVGLKGEKGLVLEALKHISISIYMYICIALHCIAVQ